MQDNELLKMYFDRNEQAISETAEQYGRYCMYIADNILQNRQDSEECVNDAYVTLWNTIPPQKPQSLKAYLAKVLRNAALSMVRKHNAKKRGSGAVDEIIDELREAETDTPESITDAKMMSELINGFVKGLEKQQRIIFVKRYWYLCPSKQIAKECDLSVGNVNMTLHRLRQQLKNYLEQEGFKI
ncbi:MAG: sigma-70 family RNA polymerase sigma factor [Ruminococcus sp.]|nr:sigma-70 family RNA polymerase sigma factor [Ruminococcus sp.]MBQ1903220.1 sigma-70 family RNA polymerase sigma factor [Ruminococcus sp.]